ncbi:MAG: hypothetical protein EXS16_21375 [Gemmataceae bacterium]|nr:hypothetical protein [Gemmataceae bacterium]
MDDAKINDLLLGYLLGALDESDTRNVERLLNESAAFRDRLAAIQRAIEPLAADRENAPTPNRLVERTLAKVAEVICRPTAPTPLADLPMAPPVSPTTIGGQRSWWRRADIVIAACLLATAVGVALTILGQMRGPSSAAMMTQCKDNLRLFFVALEQYRQLNGEFPDVGKYDKRDVAGLVVPILRDAGLLSASIRCPGVGDPLSGPGDLKNLLAMSDGDFEKRSHCLVMCYAYSLGHRDADGTHFGPGVTPAGAWSQTPIMADRPPAEGIPNNSINHGGVGQNVLFADGHIAFIPSRTIAGEDDIFLNSDNRVAAGIGPRDIVLGYSSARTSGPLP